MTPDSLTKVIERWRNLSQRYWDDGNINKSYGITECADELIRFRDAWAAQIAQDIAENRQPISSPFTEGVLHASIW